MTEAFFRRPRIRAQPLLRRVCRGTAASRYFCEVEPLPRWASGLARSSLASLRPLASESSRPLAVDDATICAYCQGIGCVYMMNELRRVDWKGCGIGNGMKWQTVTLEGWNRGFHDGRAIITKLTSGAVHFLFAGFLRRCGLPPSSAAGSCR